MELVKCIRKGLKKHMKNKFKASITVEAAFVIPIVIYTIFALMYFSFYLHDVCTIESKLDQWVHKAALSFKNPVDLDKDEILYEHINSRGLLYYIKNNSSEEASELKNLLDRDLNKGLFIITIRDIRTEVTQYKIDANVIAELKISLNPIKNMLGKYATKTIGSTQNIHNPSEFVRMSSVIIETLDLDKGINDWKEKIGSLFKSLD